MKKEFSDKQMERVNVLFEKLIELHNYTVQLSHDFDALKMNRANERYVCGSLDTIAWGMHGLITKMADHSGAIVEEGEPPEQGPIN